MLIQAGLCLTCSETTLLVFPRGGSFSHVDHCLLQYYAESHAVIYIVDSVDKERIEESKDAFGRSRL